MDKMDKWPAAIIRSPPTAMMTIITPEIPWYIRLWFLIKLPYDLTRYVITGKMYFGWR